MGGGVEVRRGADRQVTTASWLRSRHSFSFGDHYDPGNTHHGLLLAHNDDIVAPASGFDEHPHRDMEIVTWVLSGALTHRDSLGNHGVVYPGLAQRVSAGSGIVHCEHNADPVEPARFVQMWVIPDEPGAHPSYAQCDVGGQLTNRLATIASGIPGRDAAIGINNRRAALCVARLDPGTTIALPTAPYLHLFVACGRVTCADAGELCEGDAVRFTACDAPRVTAVDAAEILVWEMHATLGGR